MSSKVLLFHLIFNIDRTAAQSVQIEMIAHFSYKVFTEVVFGCCMAGATETAAVGACSVHTINHAHVYSVTSFKAT